MDSPTMFRRRFADRRRARQVARAINYAGAFALVVGSVVVLKWSPPDGKARMGMYLRDWEPVTE